MHNYQDTFSWLPHGSRRAVAGQTQRRDCWYQRVLPFVEQTADAEAYKNAETTISQYAAEYIHRLPPKIAGVAVDTFMCAPDPAGPARDGGGTNNGFQGNDAVCSGGETPVTPVVANNMSNTPIPIELNMHREDAGGTFGLRSKRNLHDCVDGTVNALLLSEGIIRGRIGASCGGLGGYWGGAPHGSYAFSTGEGSNTTVPDHVY